jgi:hypothetical protein
MQININDIILGDLTSELIDNSKHNDNEEELYINVDITGQDLKDFNERIITPSNINAIIKLCDFLMINYEEMKMLIINNMVITNEKYILNDINKDNCKDLLFLENITIDDILEHDLIEWLKFKFNECDKEKLCEKSAEKGAIKCLKYAVINKCPWDEWTCVFAAKNGQLECLKYAAKNGQLECLKYAHENGCPWNKWTCINAAENGHIECLKYAVINGCLFNDKRICRLAAEKGHIECLKYLHENGCVWDDLLCIRAASEGQLECLKYAHNNGCPWGEETCYFAARNGHIECLKYAVINGCPWNKYTCFDAAWDNYVTCLKNEYMYSSEVTNNKYYECLKYIKENNLFIKN